MSPTDLIYICLTDECQDKTSSEAITEIIGEGIRLTCGLCGKQREHPHESLNRTTLNLVRENLRGYFRVEERCE